MTHMQEAYETLITKLKAEINELIEQMDRESDKNTNREQMLFEYIVRHMSKDAAMVIAERIDEHEGKKGNMTDYVDCSF